MGAVNQLRSHVSKLPCSAHRLNLAVNDLFRIRPIKIKRDSDGNNLSYIRDIDDEGKNKDILLNEAEATRVEITNKSKETVIIPLIARCRNVVAKFRHSDPLFRRFQNLQEELDFDQRVRLSQDIPMRWNSTYDMLESLIINQPILLRMSDEDETHLLALKIPTFDEFEFLKELCDLLLPLKVKNNCTIL